jgi:xylose isomerase
MSYFAAIDPIRFRGAETDDPLAYRFYEPDRQVMGKPMAEHLRIAICYWHSFVWPGGDPFGGQTFERSSRRRWRRPA